MQLWSCTEQYAAGSACCWDQQWPLLTTIGQRRFVTGKGYGACLQVISKRPVVTATFTDVDIPGIHQLSIHKHKDAKLARVCCLENGLRQSRRTFQLQDVNGHLLSKAWAWQEKGIRDDDNRSRACFLHSYCTINKQWMGPFHYSGLQEISWHSVWQACIDIRVPLLQDCLLLSWLHHYVPVRRQIILHSPAYNTLVGTISLWTSSQVWFSCVIDNDWLLSTLTSRTQVLCLHVRAFIACVYNV